MVSLKTFKWPLVTIIFIFFVSDKFWDPPQILLLRLSGGLIGSSGGRAPPDYPVFRTLVVSYWVHRYLNSFLLIWYYVVSSLISRQKDLKTRVIIISCCIKPIHHSVCLFVVVDISQCALLLLAPLWASELLAQPEGVRLWQCGEWERSWIQCECALEQGEPQTTHRVGLIGLLLGKTLSFIVWLSVRVVFVVREPWLELSHF